MSKYLRELIAQLEDIHEFPPSPPETSPVEEGDHIVGVLDDDLKRLYMLDQRAAKKGLTAVLAMLHQCLDFMAAGLKPSDVKENLDKARAAVKTSGLESDVVRTLFWAAVKKTFPELITKDEVILRADWQVVWKERPRMIQEIMLPFP